MQKFTNSTVTSKTVNGFNRWLMSLVIAVMALAVTTSSQAQVTVTGDGAGGSPYANLQLAIAALPATLTQNTVISVDPGNPQTAPAGGYSVTTTGTASFSLTITGNSNTVTAPTPQTAGALNDAIFKIIGGDFITIQGFAMQENAANTTTAAATNNMTEWGVALLYASTTNGAQNVTIQNNTISLNRTYQNTFGIYSNSTHAATTVTTSASATTTAGGNSGLKIYSNSISNVNQGIVVVGPTAAADMNTGVEIGGASLGNTITNFGTTGTFSAYANVSGTVNGILVRNSNGYVISNNTVTSSVGGVTAGTLNGIQVPAASVTPTGTFTNNINSNIISLRSGLIGGAMTGINYPSGSASATSIVNINSNDFNTFGHTVSGTGAIIFIIQTSTHLNTTINNNTFTNIAVNTTGSVTFISSSITTPAGGSQTINNNAIVTAFSKTGAGGTITFITSGASSTTVTQSWSSNNFSNISVTGATTIAGITNTDGGSVNHNINNNIINNITGGTSSITGINSSFGGGNGGNGNLVSGNTITNITSAGAITAISIGTSGTTSTVTGNTISGLSTTGASLVVGITSGAPTSCVISKNTVCNLQSNNASGTVSGIAVTAGALHTLSNNRIADLRTPASNAANPLIGINITGGTTVNAYYNTVLLNGTSSGALFGSSAISASTTPTLTLNNNIFVNNSTVTGIGVAAAYRRSSTTLTSYASTSNRNDFFGTTIFNDGTNTDATLAAYKTRVGPSRDVNAISENASFLSTTCGNSDFLKINTATSTLLEGGGTAIAGITDDFEGNTRNATTPDIGADEFNGTSPAPSVTFNSITPSTTQCVATARVVSVTATTPLGTTITGVTITYNNGTLNSNVAMTNTSGNIWEYTIPAATPGNTTVSWSVTATNSVPLSATYTGSTYGDEPLTGATATVSANPSTICAGSSSVLTVLVSGNPTPPTGYCAASASSTTEDDIGQVTFAGINNPAIRSTPQFSNAASVNTYTDFTGIAAATVSQGSTYPMTVYHFHSTTNTSANFCNVYIDFDRDGDFSDANEVFVLTKPGATFNEDFVGNITIPSGIPFGKTRMRIILKEGAITTICGAGTVATWGEVEDYLIDIQATVTAASWSDGSTTVGTTNPVTLSPGTTTSYTATATAAGCTITSAATPVTVIPLPTAPGSGSFPSLQCGTGVPSAFVTGGLAGEYRWYTFDGISTYTLIPGETGASLTSYTISTTTNLYVAVNNGTCESAKTAVTANVVAPDAITANAAPNPVCAGSTLGLSITQTGSNQNYTFTWSALPATGSGITTTVPGAPVTGAASVTPTAAGTYSYIVNAVDGPCVTNANISVMVNPQPVITTATASPTTSCSGSPVVLTATSSTGSSGNATLGTGTGTTGATAEPTAFCNRWAQYWSQTIYTVAELQAAGLSAGSSINSISYTTTTQGDAANNTNFSIAIGNTANSVLTAFVPTGLTTVYGPVTHPHTIGTNTITFTSPFVWNGTSNIIVEQLHDGVDLTNNAVTRFTAAADNKNIWARTSTTSATTPIKTLISTASLTGTPSTTRLNIVFGFSSFVDLTGTLNWKWNDGSSDFALTSTTTVNPTATTSYTVTATNPGNGCSKSAPAIEVTVLPLPDAPIATNSQQCGTGIPTASVVSGGVNGNGTFKWYLVPTGGTPIAGESGTALSSYSISTPTDFYVSEVGTNGCESPRTLVQVTFDLTPDELTLSASPSPICLGGSTTFSFTQTGGSNSFIFNYPSLSHSAGSGINIPNISGIDSSLLDPSITITPTAAGTYTYTLKGFDPDKGCISIATTTVVVNPLPALPNSLTATPAIICEGASSVLSVVYNGSQTPPTGYCTATFSSTTEDDIGQVTFAGINNPAIRPTPQQSNAAAVNTYTDFTGVTSATVTAGSSYPMTVYQFHSTTDVTANFVNVYIDFNRNGVLNDAGEVFSLSKPGATFLEDFVGSITIPANASLGVTRMRVVIKEGAITTPCGSLGTWGEAEDYLVNIQGVDPAFTYSWNTVPATAPLPGASVSVSPTVTTNYAFTVSGLGCTNTSANVPVTVNPLPAMPSASDVSRCGAGSVTLNATGTGGTLNWYNVSTGGATLTPGGSATYTTTITVSGTIFYVAETSAAGCEGPRKAVTVTFTSAPTLAITPGGVTAFCLGGNVSLDAATGSDPGYVNFSWSSLPSAGAGLSATNIAAITVQPTVAGTYTISVAADDGILNGCANVASITVTANPNPAVPVPLATPATICAGASSVLSATYGSANPAYTAPGTTSSASGDEIQLVQFGSINNATTTGGTNGYVNYTSTIAAQAVNLGQSYTLSVSVADGGTEFAAVWFDWNRNGVFESSEFTNIPLTLGTTWDGSVSITIPSTAALGNTRMRVRSKFNVALVGTDAATAYSFGETEDYLLNVNDPAVTFSLTWNNGAFTGNPVTVSPTITTSYSAKLTNTITGCFTNAAAPVSVNVLPVFAAASATPAEICIGGSSTLSAAASTGGVPLVYSWTVLGNPTVLGTGVTLSVSPATTTVYEVTVTDPCLNSQVVQVTVTVNPLPTVSINEASNSVCSPATYGLTSTTSAASPSYQWIKVPTDIGGATASFYTVSTSGFYRLRVTDGVTGCINTSSQVTVNVNPSPADVTVSPDIAICNGSNTVLTANGGTTAGSGSAPLGAGANTTTLSTDGTPYRMGNTVGNQFKNQYLFRASELQSAGIQPGNITSAALTIVGTGGGTLSNFAIKMGSTAQTTLTSTYVTGLTTVLSLGTYPASGTVTTGVQSHTFTTAFYWDGTSNVVLEMCAQLATTGSAGTLAGDDVTFAATTLNSPTTTACGSATGGTTSTIRPKVTFGYTSLQQPIWSWTPATGLSATNIASVTATPTTTTTYTARATNSFGCFKEASVTVTVNPVTVITVGAAPVSQLVGQNTTATPLTVTATGTGTVTYQWFSNITNSNTGGTPVGTGSSYAPSTATVGTLFYYAVASSDCGTATSSVVSVEVVDANTNFWTGAGGSNWSTPGSWSLNAVPTTLNDAVIPNGATPYPILSAASTAKTILIQSTATVSLNGQTLNIVNAVDPTGTGTFIGSATSNLSVGATSTLRFASGTGGVIKNLTISGGTSTLATALDVTAGTALNTNGVVTVANGATLASGGNLTFKSNQFGTARLAQGATSGQWVTGNVTVERYIPANAQRAWRFLSVPTKGLQTINQAWQEGATPSNFNPKPGFGTRLTTPQAAYSTLGFDERTAKASIQFFNQVTGAWVDVSSTLNGGNATKIESVKGYSVFVRGDRTQAAAGATTSTNPTTLRTTGTLYTGDQAAIPVAANRFDLIGNNYVSAIDFLGLTRTNLVNTFYLWDPKLVTGTPPNVSLGGYVTFSLTNGFVGIPNSSSYGLTPRTTIQPSESFMIQANAGGGSITLRESAKVTGDGINYFRPSAPTTGFEKLKTNLYTVAADNTATMADANVSVFDGAFANAVDGDDAIKLANAGENIAIRRTGVNLVVEGRQVITDYDTTFFFMWNMRQGINYKLELITENMNVPGRSAFLIDNFTSTTTQLDLVSGITNYNYTISVANPGSFSSDRFKVVYRQIQLAPVPVTFVSIAANKKGNGVKVDWKVAAESGIRQYEVERSSDGRSFATIGNTVATGNNGNDRTYSWMDATPLTGTNFYRIKSVGIAGEIKYTIIAKVLIGDVKPAFTIAPNPVEGSVVNLQFKNQAQGRYVLRLLSNAGQTVFTTVTEHAGGNSTQIINLPTAIARGSYQMEIISPDKTITVQNLFINTLK